jgi:RNA polymerase sigma-70 factor (ECF subfamily)
MAGPQLADELTQDVFVRVWRKLASFRGESAFGTWLHRLAVNVVIERSRKDGLTRSREVEDSAGVYAVARATSPVVRLGIEAALEHLPDGARRVFVLYDIEGYTHQEIGTLLGITVGTSKTQLHRARVLLRQRLSHRSNERGS